MVYTQSWHDWPIAWLDLDGHSGTGVLRVPVPGESTAPGATGIVPSAAFAGNK